jgi:hypothetical protein
MMMYFPSLMELLLSDFPDLSTGKLLGSLHEAFPTLKYTGMLISLARQSALSGLVADDSEWPSPHICLAYHHHMFLQR